MLLSPTLSGCRQAPTPPEPARLRLDCGRGFAALSADIAAVPEVQLARAPGEPYHYYSTSDGQTSWVITLPGGAGHPAIVEQDVVEGRMVETGCAYGDTRGYNELVTYLRGLARVRPR